MRISILSCVLLILSTSVFAGTWKDDFEDGILADWKEAGADTKWSESKGVVVSELPQAESGNRRFLVTGDASWENYTVTVNLRVVNLVGGDWCGILLRYNNEDSYHWFGLSVAWTSYAAGTADETKEQENLRVGFGQWYELRAEVENDNFKFFVNDELVLEFVDSILLSGQVGLYTQNSMTEFDDFSVTGPEIPDGGPGFPVETKDRLATTWSKIKHQNFER